MAKPWTTREVATLREKRELGAVTLAEILGRTVCSVREAARRNRISLRRPGWAGGRVLDQRHGVRVCRDAHCAIVADSERAMRRAELYRAAALCPDCGRRRVEIAQTGLCQECHSDYLKQCYSRERPALKKAEALFLAIAEEWGGELDTQLLLARARKRRQRAREGS